MLACGDRDIYDEDDPPVIPASLYNLSQLVQDVNSSPTQEDPGVPARSPRTEEALQPVPLDWVTESERNAPLDPILEDQEQEVGLQQDPCLPSLSDEPIPLGQGCSRQKFEQWSFQSEPTEQRVREFVQEAQCRASHQETSDTICGHSSKLQEVSNHRLGFVRERMLRDSYKPEYGSVWAEQKVMAKLHGLK